MKNLSIIPIFYGMPTGKEGSTIKMDGTPTASGSKVVHVSDTDVFIEVKNLNDEVNLEGQDGKTIHLYLTAKRLYTKMSNGVVVTEKYSDKVWNDAIRNASPNQGSFPIGQRFEDGQLKVAGPLRITLHNPSFGGIDIRMKGKSGNTIWEENNSIKSGTFRTFFCGNDVYYLEARCADPLMTSIRYEIED